MTNPVVVAKIDQEKRIVPLMVSLVRKDDRDFQTYRNPVSNRAPNCLKPRAPLQIVPEMESP